MRQNSIFYDVSFDIENILQLCDRILSSGYKTLRIPWDIISVILSFPNTVPKKVSFYAEAIWIPSSDLHVFTYYLQYDIAVRF